MSVLMNVVSICRSRSGLAWASCSSRKRAGPILLGAVIAFELLKHCGRSPEDHAVAASTSGPATHRGRRTPPWRTPLQGQRTDSWSRAALSAGALDVGVAVR